MSTNMSAGASSSEAEVKFYLTKFGKSAYKEIPRHEPSYYHSPVTDHPWFNEHRKLVSTSPMLLPLAVLAVASPRSAASSSHLPGILQNGSISSNSITGPFQTQLPSTGQPVLVPANLNMTALQNPPLALGPHTSFASNLMATPLPGQLLAMGPNTTIAPNLAAGLSPTQVLSTGFSALVSSGLTTNVSPGQHLAMAPATIFHRFDELPLELRLRIWRFAFMNAPRFVHFMLGSKKIQLFNRQVLPPSGNSEGRNEAIRLHNRLDAQSPAAKIFRQKYGKTFDKEVFDPAVDIALFVSPYWFQLNEDTKMYHALEVAGFSNLRFMTFERLTLTVPKAERNTLNGFKLVIEEFHHFPKLETLRVIRICLPRKSCAPPYCGLSGCRDIPNVLMSDRGVEKVIRQVRQTVEEKRAYHPTWTPLRIIFMSYSRKPIYTPEPTTVVRAVWICPTEKAIPLNINISLLDCIVKFNET
ncbi:hypothetical protein G7Y89_g6812 [Cudoniella acicularis]|uniref:2EXR domain-containing protein n=1 Tax=Cudoniella acicularis TaxID=354080 RepID=A0A8H4RLZ2_9HELO|nr:hypothetical protein G7Y89_g6812 [Cudoniella acicularis]